jgi:uncharacterized RDD family membrane protein YckC
MTAEAYIHSVIDHMPLGLPLREQIAMELGSHIAERVAHGQALDAVLRQLGDPLVLAESYLAAVPLRNASIGGRILAKLIDFLIVAAVAVSFSLLLWLVFPPEWRAFVPIICVMLCVFGFVGYTIFAEYRFGQTAGKRVMDIRVVRESGARIGLGQAFLRQLPWFAQMFWLDALFALFTQKNQRAFELITKTRAVMIAICVMLYAA